MPEIHPACQPIADEIESLQQEIRTLSEDLHTVPTNQKAAIVLQIKKLKAKVAAKQKALNQCMAEHPLPTPVASTLTGRAGIWRRPGNGAGYFAPVTLGMTFSGFNYAHVELRFPDMVFRDVIHFSTAGLTYSADVTVSLARNMLGGYNSISHHISIPLELTLTPSGLSGFLGFLYPMKPSKLSFLPPGLTTHAIGAPVNPSASTWQGSPLITTPGPYLGRIRLIGRSHASEGFCDGWGIDLEISGILQPVP
jgi:hypothetical protein